MHNNQHFALPPREIPRQYYLYMMYHDTGYYYIGRASTEGKPEDHVYWGSGLLLWRIYKVQGYRHSSTANPPGWTKHIIRYCDSQEHAISLEKQTIIAERSSLYILNRTHENLAGVDRSLVDDKLLVEKFRVKRKSNSDDHEYKIISTGLTIAALHVKTRVVHKFMFFDFEDTRDLKVNKKYKLFLSVRKGGKIFIEPCD